MTTRVIRSALRSASLRMSSVRALCANRALALTRHHSKQHYYSTASSAIAKARTAPVLVAYIRLRRRSSSC